MACHAALSNPFFCELVLNSYVNGKQAWLLRPNAEYVFFFHRFFLFLFGPGPAWAHSDPANKPGPRNLYVNRGCISEGARQREHEAAGHEWDKDRRPPTASTNLSSHSGWSRPLFTRAFFLYWKSMHSIHPFVFLIILMLSDCDFQEASTVSHESHANLAIHVLIASI